MAFTIKAAKPKKRGKGAKPLPRELCNDSHCTSTNTPCTEPGCNELLKAQLHDLKNENLSLSLALDSRKDVTEKLETEMKASCSILSGFRTLLESKTTLKDAMSMQCKTVTCPCAACGVSNERSETEILRKKIAAQETYLDTLRERSAADHEAEDDNSKNYFGKGKYFTRSGTYRGHGASALKPKLQMQNSYDVAALTTNTMNTKPIKLAEG